jgi:hypothetical protein
LALKLKVQSVQSFEVFHALKDIYEENKNMFILATDKNAKAIANMVNSTVDYALHRQSKQSTLKEQD